MQFLPLHSTIHSRPLSTLESLIAFLTDYRELALATSDADLLIVFTRLQGEWSAVGRLVRFLLWALQYIAMIHPV